MDTVTRLIQHPLYKEKYDALQAYEKERLYCRHDMRHFMRVAQIADQIARENGLSFSAEEITLVALLHDIGRIMQYQNNISHAEASASFAREILLSLGYDDKKTEEIRKAIIAHSNRMDAKKRFARRGELQSLEELLSFADQFSRECFSCEVKDRCKWKTEEKIDYVYFDIETKQERKKGGEQ